MKRYFRRYNLALRGRDDHRLAESARAPLAALAEQLSAERNQLVLQLAEHERRAERYADLVSQRDQLASQLAGITSESQQLVQRFAELASQRDQLASQLAERLSALEQLAKKEATLVSQIDWRVSTLEQIAEKHGELVTQPDHLAAGSEAPIAQRSQLIEQLAASVAERKQLAAHYTDLASERDRLNAQINGLVTQASAMSTLVVERDRLAAQLAETVAGGAAPQNAKILEDLRARYLDLMESALTGSIVKDPPFPVFGWDAFDENARDRGLDWPRNAFSMIGAARMRNLRTCVERAILSNIPGDIVETGVWRGGASILVRAVLAAYGSTDRKVILADSFEGLPPPDEQLYPADQGSIFHQFAELAVSLEQVRDNFTKFGLLDDQVVFLKGWFKDTMAHVPAQQIAVLRLDGDMYESTIDPLNHLFDKVSAGGWIIVDDYEWVPACKAAVDDFLAARGLKPEIQQIDGVGVFFQKSA
jgi:uncharacterized coiled-coil DUF342 family protein